MPDGYGLHQLTWDTCDERFGDVLVVSPADAEGRGISLAVRQGGAPANLTGATFTGAVSGIPPTANAHFATKQYVDGAIPSLSGYATETWVTQQINAAIAALDDLSEESF